MSNFFYRKQYCYTTHKKNPHFVPHKYKLCKTVKQCFSTNDIMVYALYLYCFKINTDTFIITYNLTYKVDYYIDIAKYFLFLSLVFYSFLVHAVYNSFTEESKY